MKGLGILAAMAALATADDPRAALRTLDVSPATRRFLGRQIGGKSQGRVFHTGGTLGSPGRTERRAYGSKHARRNARRRARQAAKR